MAKTTIARITSVDVYESGLASVHWIGSDGKRGSTSGQATNTHMQQLLARAGREGTAVGRPVWHGPDSGYLYIIKCDDCKHTIGQTNSLTESVAGGQCATC